MDGLPRKCNANKAAKAISKHNEPKTKYEIGLFAFPINVLKNLIIKPSFLSQLELNFSFFSSLITLYDI